MDSQFMNELNVLGAFCGIRDIPELTTSELQLKYGLSKVDVMVLFGGSILCGGDVLAQAIKNQVAEKYVIVGGAGHTTDTLRKQVSTEIEGYDMSPLSEAEIFDLYLKKKYGLEVDFLECQSTNCGNNITFMLELFEKNDIPVHSIILSQDATMQRRMDAVLRKYKKEWTIVNYATYCAKLIEKDGKLQYENTPLGMWDVTYFARLLMGEIPRLMDNTEGYGPKGKGFIAHVDIPENIIEAYVKIKQLDESLVRKANPIFAKPQ